MKTCNEYMKKKIQHDGFPSYIVKMSKAQKSLKPEEEDFDPVSYCYFSFYP
jgi:hypothetical protein